MAAVGEDVRAESPKNLESRGRCKRCRFTHGGSERPPLFARSQPRGPPYEDWFHETPRARPARLLRTTIEGEKEGQRQRDRRKQRRSHGEKERKRETGTHAQRERECSVERGLAAAAGAERGRDAEGGTREAACGERARGVWVPFFGERLVPASARKYCYLDRAFGAHNVLQNAMQAWMRCIRIRV